MQYMNHFSYVNFFYMRIERSLWFFLHVLFGTEEGKVFFIRWFCFSFFFFFEN